MIEPNLSLLSTGDLEKQVAVRLLAVLAERFDRERLRRLQAQQQLLTAELQNRPCMALAPLLLERDGRWEAIRGDLVGRGDTPDGAMDDFDHVYTNGFSK